MEYNVHWKNRKPTAPGWEPEDEHGIVLLVQRHMRVVGFIRDGVRVEFDEPDLEYFTNKFDDLVFEQA